MPRTKKPKAGATPQFTPQSGIQNGPLDKVLTLAEAADYLRLDEAEVVALVQSQNLPGRFSGSAWRFLKSAIEDWLRSSAPPPKGSKEAWLSLAGSCKDDPDLEEIVEQAYRQRGRPITEDGSHKNFGSTASAASD